LTKQASDEATLRCHVTLEEVNKVSPSVTEAIVKNALVICGTHIDPEQEGKRKRILVKTRMNSLRSRLGRIMRRLYDLETGNEPEKPLKIDFDCDLYQMENF
jgi:cell division GTPase FtsZ